MIEFKTKDKYLKLNTKDNLETLNYFIKERNITKLKDKEYSPNSSAASNYVEIGRSSIKGSTLKTKQYVNFIKNKKFGNDKNTYMSKAKNYVKKKLNKLVVNNVSPSIINNPILKNSRKAILRAIEYAKKSVAVINAALSFSTGLVLMLIMTMFIGTFSVFAKDEGNNSEIISLSDEVLAYEETITLYAEQNGIEDYISLIEAIMMHETRGVGNDPMNASSFTYNYLYPNGIDDPEYSIDVGIHFLSDCISKANVSDNSDTEHLYLAIQGYNLGLDYIDWAIDNFDGYSKYNAQIYSEMNDNVGDIDYVTNIMQYVGFSFRGGTSPNFDNQDAWIIKNPYAPKFYGQCTWFAWGRFYELYGYDPGFTGDGKDCVDQLVIAHPDRFEKSYSPKAGAIFSGLGHNHVGIVLEVNGELITLQEGNLDGKTNTFQEAKTDWHTARYSLTQLFNIYGGVVFANPIKK